MTSKEVFPLIGENGNAFRFMETAYFKAGLDPQADHVAWLRGSCDVCENSSQRSGSHSRGLQCRNPPRSAVAGGHEQYRAGLAEGPWHFQVYVFLYSYASPLVRQFYIPEWQRKKAVSTMLSRACDAHE